MLDELITHWVFPSRSKKTEQDHEEKLVELINEPLAEIQNREKTFTK